MNDLKRYISKPIKVRPLLSVVAISHFPLKLLNQARNSLSIRVVIFLHFLSLAKIGNSISNEKGNFSKINELTRSEMSKDVSTIFSKWL